ncbi:MAG: Maf family protein, partial [Alphaproteobacteria bacterium]|nr:Maf family protein [Alphaproteobacteria bacterium]
MNMKTKPAQSIHTNAPTQAQQKPVWQNPNMRLVLASTSHIRATILNKAGLCFDICAPLVDESALKKQYKKQYVGRDESTAPLQKAQESPQENMDLAETLARQLAIAKAQSVAHSQANDKNDKGGLVLGADQILTCQGRFFDKPQNMAEAADNLRFLRGKTHTLTAGVALIGGGGKYKKGEIIWQTSAVAHLTMHAFSDAFLAAY